LVSISLQNQEVISPRSVPVRLTSQSTSKVPNEPRITLVAYDKTSETLFLQWIVVPNEGPAVERVNVTFTRYDASGFLEVTREGFNFVRFFFFKLLKNSL